MKNKEYYQDFISKIEKKLEFIPPSDIERINMLKQLKRELKKELKKDLIKNYNKK